MIFGEGGIRMPDVKLELIPVGIDDPPCAANTKRHITVPQKEQPGPSLFVQGQLGMTGVACSVFTYPGHGFTQID